MSPTDRSDERMEEPRTHGDIDRQRDYLHGVDQVARVAGPRSEGQDLPVGQRVRQIREQKGLTLTDLAQRTGLMEQFLADIEAETASPPLGVLVKLGKALGMKMGTLIASGEERPYTVVRSSERQAMSRLSSQRGTAYGYSYQSLAPKKKNRSMDPFVVTLEQAAQDVPPSSHEGEEFIFVLEGSMEALVGEAMEILGPGDSIYYDSSEPHLLRPHGEGPTRILAVIYSQDR
ncbi:MAG: XRE family transcriptional regulator [Desulfarculus sp.]|nr:XRE family transcriptional regulator [Desulfarculus sp.]